MRSYKAHYEALVVALLDSRYPVASNWNSAGRQCTLFTSSTGHSPRTWNQGMNQARSNSNSNSSAAVVDAVADAVAAAVAVAGADAVAYKAL